MMHEKTALKKCNHVKKELVGSLAKVISSEFLPLQEDRSIQEKHYRETAEEVNDPLLFCGIAVLGGRETPFLHFPDIQTLEIFNVILWRFL